jgi:putative membrane protein
VNDPPTPFETERGSRARDHLANERTFLAWLRTAATVMVLGLAVAKFVEEGNARTEVAGGILLVTGALGVIQGAMRYRRVNRELESGHFVTGALSREPIVAGVVLLVAVVVAFVLILL